MVVYQLFLFAFFVLMIASSWKVFTKAGQPGWACFIPIYNIIVMLQIAKKPTWWVLLYFIPLVNIVIQILVILETGKLFGKDTVWSFFLLVLFPFIGYPILAFGDAQYDNSNGSGAGFPPSSPTPPAEPLNPVPVASTPDSSIQINSTENPTGPGSESNESASAQPTPLEQMASNQAPSEPVQELGTEDKLQVPPMNEFQAEPQEQSTLATAAPEQTDQTSTNQTPPATPPVV